MSKRGWRQFFYPLYNITLLHILCYLVSVTVVASDSSVGAEDLLLSVMLSFSRASVGTSLQRKSAAAKYFYTSIITLRKSVQSFESLGQVE